MATVYKGYPGDSAVGARLVTVITDGNETPLSNVGTSQGFSWGYSGTGPLDLALSLLTDALGWVDPPLARDYAADVVATLPPSWELPRADVQEWAARKVRPEK